MRHVSLLLALGAFLLGAVASGCAGAKAVKKGTLVRCPSCGAEFKVEEGLPNP
ncbi:MAG: hypothetical protein Kow0092_16120 [Deferrisomatales bacterium]